MKNITLKKDVRNFGPTGLMDFILLYFDVVKLKPRSCFII